MADHKPDPIERMARVYLRDRGISLGDLGAASSAMLAAVRELRIIADADPAGRSRESAWLDGLIDDHQRRAGGKGE